MRCQLFSQSLSHFFVYLMEEQPRWIIKNQSPVNKGNGRYGGLREVS